MAEPAARRTVVPIVDRPSRGRPHVTVAMEPCTRATSSTITTSDRGARRRAARAARPGAVTVTLLDQQTDHRRRGQRRDHGDGRQCHDAVTRRAPLARRRRRAVAPSARGSPAPGSRRRAQRVAGRDRRARLGARPMPSKSSRRESEGAVAAGSAAPPRRCTSPRVVCSVERVARVDAADRRPRHASRCAATLRDGHAVRRCTATARTPEQRPGDGTRPAAIGQHAARSPSRPHRPQTSATTPIAHTTTVTTASVRPNARPVQNLLERHDAQASQMGHARMTDTTGIDAEIAASHTAASPTTDSVEVREPRRRLLGRRRVVPGRDRRELRRRAAARCSRSSASPARARAPASMALLGLLPDERARHAASSSSRGRELRRRRRRDAAPGPRQGDRGDLPGADDGAEPGLHDRLPDRRDAAHRTSSMAPSGRQGAGDRAARAWSRCPTPSRRSTRTRTSCPAVSGSAR